MNSEKMKILEMIQDGKISADQGLELLEALDVSESNITIEKPNRFLKIKVTNNGQKKVNVNIPMGIVKAAGKFATMGMKMIPENARKEMQKNGVDLSEINFEELIDLVDKGVSDGKLVDIDTQDPKDGATKVEIYVD